MIPGLTLVRVLATDVFTKTTRHGQFHGDPGSERNCRPKVPDYVVGELLAAGKIALLEEDEGESGAPPLAPLDARSEYEMTHLGFGRYAVSGPGIAPGTEVKGKADAETLIKSARAAFAEGAAADEAPVD